MSGISKFITVLKEKRVESLKNARQKNNLPLFTGEAIAYRESIDLANKMLMTDEPTLSPNQKIVLEWFKEEHEFMLKHRTYFSFISCLDNVFTHHSIYIKRNLTNEQQAQVLQIFSQWVLEQEEK